MAPFILRVEQVVPCHLNEVFELITLANCPRLPEVRSEVKYSKAEFGPEPILKPTSREGIQ